MMKAHKYKLLCPFCGSECKRICVPVMLNSGYVEYRCTNESCGAIMSFDNIDCNLNPNATDRYFLSRYYGARMDGDEE